MKLAGLRLALVSCALAGLAACTIGPDYRRPPVTPPERFRSQAPGTEASSLADLPWWQAFGDATLRDLIQEAIAGNYDLRVAAARVQQARAYAGIARAAYFPSIGYTSKVQRSKEFEAFLGISPSQIDDSGNNLFLGALSASWEIDLWGAVRRSNEAALAQLTATEDGQRAVLLSLVSEVAQNYFELIELDARLDVAKKTTAAYQGIYKIFQDRLEFGVVSEVQTSRAEGSWAAAAATIPEVETQIAAKENQISTLLGRNPGPIPRGTPLFAQPVAPTVPAGLPSALLERRPDLLRAEELIRAANAQVGVAKADFLPKLSLTGMVGKASPELATITAGGSTIWAIAAGLAGPIFQGGRIYYNYRATQAAWEQARLQYEQAVIRAFQEVASNLDALDRLSRAEAEQVRAVAALEKSVQHATDRYLYGFASYYEVLEAEERLYSAQNALVSIRTNRLLAYVQLYKALGGGWNVTNPAAPPAAPARAACDARSC
jgi:multidrug efflux system outer membrane protein